MSQPEPRLIRDTVVHWALTTPDAEALTFQGSSWTWAELDGRVRRISGALHAAGIGRGEVVAFLDKNHPACLEVTLGASALGAANAVVNWRLSAEELLYVLDDCGASIAFVGAELLDLFDTVRDKLSALDRVVVVGGAGDEYEALVATADAWSAPSPAEPDDPALVLYTSGTTGHPKGAMLTHRSLIAHTLAAAPAMRMGAGDRNVVALPLFHVGGSCYALLGIHTGIPTVVAREASPEVLFPALAHGATHLFAVPALLGGIIAAGDHAVAALSGLKVIAYGASPMPLPLLHSCLQAWPDADFVQVYGMTELSGVVTVLGPEAHRDTTRPDRLTSAGTAISGIAIRVVDPGTGAQVADGEPGELWFRTDQCMAGYLDKPEATAAAITADGWLRSGDIGRVDDGGFVFLEDRVKDMVITGGENVYSPEVERVLIEHPDVADVAVIGIPDDVWGESVKAIVVPAVGQAPDRAELIAYARQRLAHYKCPRSIDIVAELPRTTTGKVLKRDLRAPYWQHRSKEI